MRTEFELLIGPRGWGDTRASWLARVPKAVKRALGTERETVSHRTAKAIWYGEISDPDHHAVRDIKTAATITAAKRETAALAEKYKGLIGALDAANPDLYRAEIDRLERVARLLCGGDRPR